MNITKESKKIILANNLQHLMTIHNITRKELCKALNIPRETLRNWVNALEYPPIEKIAMLANFFNVEISSLIQEHNFFDGLTKEDLLLVHDMQQYLSEQGFPPMYLQVFTANAVFVIKYIKERNLYGGYDNE